MIIAIPGESLWAACDIDCGKRCRIKVFGKKITEPTCKINCEARKKACKIDNRLDKLWPPSALELVQKGLNQACALGFDAVTKATIAQCSSWNGRLDGAQQLNDAKKMLIEAGVFAANNFNGVQIRFCPIQAHGIAPDRNYIYIDIDYIRRDPIELAVLIAHEMKHRQQYVRMGTENFKCTYTRKFLECKGCQEEGHPLEAEAYKFEEIAEIALLRKFGNKDGSGATYAWKLVGTGDCGAGDYKTSAGARPILAECNAAVAGRTSVCWMGGENPHYPPGAAGVGAGGSPDWCTYKTTAAAACTGGLNPGTKWVCAKEERVSVSPSASAIAAPTYTWKLIRTGDCGGTDYKCSAGRQPVVGECNVSAAGLASVCWEGGQNPHYPPGGAGNGCRGASDWCTYKTTPASTCTGGGLPGSLYVCSQDK